MKRSAGDLSILPMRRPDPRRWDIERLAQLAADDDDLAAAGLVDWATGLQGEDEGYGRRTFTRPK